MHTGEAKTRRGPAGEGTTTGISARTAAAGDSASQRFKTGTPARLNGRTIDYSQTEIQPGDDQPTPFSFLTDAAATWSSLPCWITHTTASRPRSDPRQSAPRADVQRADSVERTALLPVDRR